jgi:GrpB-like predicted nucleotidyltransferase (UPF0157 family)
MITITGYNEDWPRRFGEIRDCLRSELEAECGPFDIEHFGSTAVPGLVARPLLDLCVVVPEASALPGFLGGLDRLGYIYERDQGVPGLETFRRKGPDVPFLAHKRDFSPHHLYAAVADSSDLGRHLAFRDQLKHASSDSSTYAKLKIDLAPHADAAGYLQAKTEFIETVLARFDW